MDEAYSLGLASYDKVEIQNNEDFYNTWHNKEYYEDYLSVQEDERGQYNQVYENQKNDVHPPFYYLLLRFGMGFTEGHFTKWPGIVINIVIYAFITVFMYLILQNLFRGEKKAKEKSILLAFLSSITMASLTNVIYIRMYALSMLNILIITFLHIKLLQSKETNWKLLIGIGVSALIGSLTHYYYLFYLAMLYIIFVIKYIKEKRYNKETNWKLLIGIGVSALIGSLTHYYYLFYLAMLYIIFVIKYIKEKRYKELGYYTLTMIGAGILSLIIFPYSIQHMFFGYRGQGAISNLTDIQKFLSSIYYTLTMIGAGILSLIIFPYSIQHMFFGYRGQGAISNLTDIQKFLSSISLYIQKVSEFGFNNLLYIILLMIIGIVIYKIIKKKKSINDKEKNKVLQMIVIPTIFYFIIVSIASPWIELRYISPVCSLIFIIIMYLLYELLKDIMSEKMSNIIFILVCASILISPIVCKIEPEVMYSDKKEIVHKLEEELNVPTIYIFNSENNRFLDDILLFSKINESYIAKDIEITEDNVKDILKGKDISNEKNKVLQMIVIPTIFYFIIVSIASPWIELRYISPVCSLIFIIIMYLLYELLKDIMSEKMSNIIFILVCASILISPIVCKIEPEVMYSDKKEIVHKLEEELNVPTIYIFNSENNRFLDDILLFSKINESYIAKDIEITEDNVKDILKGKDISNGVVVFINEGQNNDEIIDTIKKATGLEESEYLKRLNACDVYTISASQETK